MAQAYCAPSLALLGLEPVRAVLEYIGAWTMDRRALPAGDGHPVVLFPGLASDQTCLAPLREFCQELGYEASDWGRGFNTGPPGDVEAWVGELAREVADAAERRGRRISLVGWSLGGLYAREIARLVPHSVRQVITLGSPFAADGDATNVGWLCRMLGGLPARIAPELAQRLPRTPPVPTTSVYSRSDGVVAWQACVEPCDHRQAQNIEVEASHVGLVWSSRVWSVVADRLAQPEGRWRLFGEPAKPMRSASRASAAGVAALATAQLSAKAGRLAA